MADKGIAETRQGVVDMNSGQSVQVRVEGEAAVSERLGSPSSTEHKPDNETTTSQQRRETNTSEQSNVGPPSVNHLDVAGFSTTTTHKRTWSFWSRYKSDDNDNDNVAERSRSQSAARHSSKSDTPPRVTTVENNLGPAAPKYGNPLANTYIPYDAETITNESHETMSGQIADPVADEEEQEPNIVVPSFDILPQKSLWNSFYDMIGSRNSNPQKYVYRTDPKYKLNALTDHNRKPLRVLIVGVHGFFPLKMLRTFIGQPTGTSMKFITEAESVVKKYFKEKSIPIEISKISLEREGEIFDRVDFFFDVMRRYAREINDSDFIYFVSHSQGCPVTIILLARLI